LAIDSSKIRLPDSREIQDAFGTINTTNGKDSQIVGCHAHGLASVCYDVLNRIVIDSQLGGARAYEVDLAVRHLPATQANDLLLLDRGYASYRWLATGIQYQRHLVVRCSAASFKPARQMLEGLGADSQVVDLTPSVSKRLAITVLGLPSSLRVRFVRVVLPNGDFEVLVTNLLDEAQFPTSSVRQLYHLRWGVETLYGVVKTRLQLENFSGLTAESVRQDFYATIFITNLESVLTEEATTRLEKKTSKNLHPQQVNQAVSFNAIKNYVIALFYLENNSEEILRQLTQLFLTNPSSVRPQRSTPRRQRSTTQRLNYHRRLKKICF
jgi:Transposase DDE domain